MSRVFHFKGEDLSKVEATPDFLVEVGEGLMVFLKMARGTGDLPHKTLGDQDKPAKMALGRALAMHGDPKSPGKDDRKNDSAPLESEMEKLVLKEPMTERKWRMDDVKLYPYTKTELLAEPAQWQLFRTGKLLPHTALLSRQYCHLVAQKKLEEREAENANTKAAKSADQPSAGSSNTSEQTETAKTVTKAPDASEEATTTNTSWPPSEEQDWVGFTNWVARCEKADPTFGQEFVVSWAKARQARIKDLQERLDAWSPPKDFWANYNFPRPTDFYRGPPIDIEDAEKIGIKLDVKDRY